MNSVTKYLESRIRHAGKRAKAVKEAHGDEPEITHNYFGGYTLGYWEGLRAAYENILDKIGEETKLEQV